MRNIQLDEKAVFDVARRIDSPDARLQYLQQVCGDDNAMLERVAALARIHDEQLSFLETSPPDANATVDLLPISERSGTQIGPYTLLEKIGEGGMGVVYLAEQAPPIRRKVALKIIKPGMDTHEVVARFEAERQALALMDHPNIAKVFDGGVIQAAGRRRQAGGERPGAAVASRTSDDGTAQYPSPSSDLHALPCSLQAAACRLPPAGRPYFVMELVRGTPITEFCDQQKLTTRERLELFVTLCHGVQHAHQKGVIHRDLKPSNLLVEVHDSTPVPKIIDFGVAKAVGQHLTDKTLHTGLSQMVGTPRYMSPEQAGQGSQDVDTRSDIYSLGVVLYEMLTGTTPFESDTLRGVGYDELRRIIREVDPPRPSVRISTFEAADLSTIAERHQIEPRKLSQQLRGDLDWIVMKALEKDRDRRYETANGLAADVERYLNDEPVVAKPPTLANHLTKWVRRHLPLVWSSAAVLTVAAVLSGGVFWSGFRRAVQLDRDSRGHFAAAAAFLGAADYTAADRELADARGHLEAANYGRGPLSDEVTRLGGELSAKHQAIKQFDEFQQLRHRVHSEMYAVDQAILDQAQEHCRAALDLYQVLESDTWQAQAGYRDLRPAQQASAEEGVVELLFLFGRLQMDRRESQAPAEHRAGDRRAVEAFSRIQTFPTPIPAVYLWIADCYDAAGDTQAANEARAKAEVTQRTTAVDHFLLGQYHAHHGRQDQALASYWQALTQQPDHYLSILAAGAALGELKNYESAEAMLTGAIAMNPRTVIAYVQRALARQSQNKTDLAQADIQEAKKLDPELASALLSRAGEYQAKYQFDKALADYSEAVRLDPTTAAYAGRGVNYLLQGDLEKALADCNERIRLEPGSASAYAMRAEVYRVKGDWVKALADADEAIRLDPQFARSYVPRAWIRFYQGQLDNALTDYHEAIRLDPKDAGLFPGRALVYLKLGEREKALADCRESIRLDPTNVWGHLSLAATYRDGGESDQALATLDEAVRIAPQYSVAYRDRGDFYKDRGDFERALADYNEAVRLAPTDPGLYLGRGDFYKNRGETDKALVDYSEAIRLEPGNGNWYGDRGAIYLDHREFKKAAADLDRAAELSPISWHHYKRRALAHFRLKHYDQALESIAKAVELNPGDGSNLWWIPPVQVAKCPDERLRQGLLELADQAIEKTKGAAESYAARAMLYEAFGRRDEAHADFDKALQLEPTNWLMWDWRTLIHGDLERWDEAIVDLSKYVEFEPERVVLRCLLALAQLGAGRLDEYRQHCAEILDRFCQTQDAGDAFWTVWACVLGPDAVTDWPRAIALAETIDGGDPKSARYLNALGAIHYRAGRMEEAVQQLTQADQLMQNPSELQPASPAYTWFFLAMTHHRLGRADEAKKWFDKATAWTDKIVTEADEGTADLRWNRRLTLKLLRDESTALLGETPATVEPAPEPAAKEEEKLK